MKIESKLRQINHLHFSQGPEKGVKISHCRFVYEKAGTSTKTKAKRPFLNSFPVPLNAWDKPGTRVGQADGKRGP